MRLVSHSSESAPAESGRPPLAELALAPPERRLDLLGSAPGGLSDAEAARRLRRYGPNEAVPPEQRRLLLRFLANFTHTLALLLWFAAGLAFASGLPQLGAAVVAVIGVNGVFAFVQEYRAERVIESLMKRVAVNARVVRDGVERAVLAEVLVPGDVVRMAAGDIVPADCALVTADNLTLDLSVVTGESAPVARDAAPVGTEDGRLRLSDLACMASAGCGVATGSAEAVVWATGPESTMGTVASLVGHVRRGASVLEQQVSQLSMLTATIAVIAGAATLSIAATATEVKFLVALTFATGVIVALVPEGLLPTLSIALALAAGRMAQRGAAVRRLSAVEAVGAVTVICTDKTGTLTQNTLSVLGFVPADGMESALEEAYVAAALCNDAHPADGGFAGDSIDVALARWVQASGRDVQALRAAQARVADVPFDARHRYMSVTCESDGARTDYIKGAPENVLALMPAAPVPPAIDAAMSAAMRRGERVLLLAGGPSGGAPRLYGLVMLHDPPRPEVPAAIAACERARVRVVMLTGDHPETAKAIAAAVGLRAQTLEVIDGDDMERMSDVSLLARLRSDAVFARIDPAQKLRITSLLRASGEVVVVTGDGINDAPALRAADVGVAMGRRGTEVAKQAADIVLADDNFATIVAAIEEGRSIKANIRRFASYVFTSNVAELAPFVLYIFLPMPLPLAIAQVLAIDLGTDLLPALALGAEAPSPRTMEQPPESPHRPILTRRLALRTFLFFGGIESLLGLAAFFAVFVADGWRPFDSLDAHASVADAARAMTFLGIVSGQIGCLFAQRDGPLLRRLSLTSNRLVTWALAGELCFALALVYVPGVNGLFSMSSVHPAWLLVLPCGALAFVLADQVRRLVEERGGIAHPG
jgi:magnesium-transporting ATPase (P-type)